MNAGRRPGSTYGAGFTLVELIAILLLVGILAMVALPRFFNAASHSGRGFSDQAAAFLRYAQKLAVARHGSVYVQLEADALTLCLSATRPCPAGQGAPGPDGATPYRIEVPEEVSLNASDALFAFDAAGRPSLAGNFTLTVGADINRTLTVEAETGYVH